MEEPDSIHPLLNSVSEVAGCDSSLVDLSNKEPMAEGEECTCTNVNENVKNQAHWVCNCCSPVNEENAIDKEDVDKVGTCEEISLCRGSDHSLSSDSRVHKCLSKCASFPSSELGVSHPTSSSKVRSASRASAAVNNPSGDQHAAYKRSISLPTNTKLISAMKGGRAQNGSSLSTGVRVKWAEDVYDPPATSMSHTVNSSYRRSKSGKKKEKQRHKHRGRKSRGIGSGGGGDMKLCNRLAQPAEAASDKEITESAFGGGGGGGVQDVKCGSVFLRESHANLHMSFGEAT